MSEYQKVSNFIYRPLTYHILYIYFCSLFSYSATDTYVYKLHFLLSFVSKNILIKVRNLEINFLRRKAKN